MFSPRPLLRRLEEHRAERLLRSQNAGKEAIRYMKEAGVTPLLDYFEDEPEIPSDFTCLPSHDLGSIYSRVCRYTEYLETRLTLLEIEADEQELLLENLQAKVRLAKVGTVPDKKAKTLSDPECLVQSQVALVARAKAKLFRVRVKGLERTFTALSREMTRRQTVPER